MGFVCVYFLCFLLFIYSDLFVVLFVYLFAKEKEKEGMGLYGRGRGKAMGGNG